MARKVYPDETQARAVLLYLEYGAAEAARRVGVPAGTIRSWASRADVATTRLAEIDAHVEALQASAEERKAALALKMLLIAEKAAEAELDKIGDAPLFQVVGARTRAIHDHQLLTGAATARSEHLAPTEAAHAVIDEVAERRSA